MNSVLRFRINARVFASDQGLTQGRVSGMALDALKVRSAVVRGVLDFDLRRPVVCPIMAWRLLDPQGPMAYVDSASFLMFSNSRCCRFVALPLWPHSFAATFGRVSTRHMLINPADRL